MTAQLATTLASRLSQLAADYDREAAACRAAGGSWSLVLADEHARAAAQLRAVRDLLDDPTPEHIATASQWAHAAQLNLERMHP